MCRNSSRSAAPEDSGILATAARRQQQGEETGTGGTAAGRVSCGWRSRSAGAMLPSIYLKCTSMIMDTMDFSIDYSAPVTSASLRSSYNQVLIQWTRPVKSSSLQSRDHVSGCDEKNKMILRSNVKMTLRYLGSGLSVTNEIINPKDQVSVFQQICGGESVCVFKGYLSPGETFQILSRRHYGFPFSAGVYINGLIASRISWCCEYRHHVGFQQGRRGCFQITRLSGGKPCHRCVDKKYQTRLGRKDSAVSTYEGPITSETGEVGNMETNIWLPPNLCPAPPNPAPPNPCPAPPNPSVRRRKKKPPRKEESDSEQENKVQKNERRPRRRGSRAARAPPSLKDDKSGQTEKISPAPRTAGANQTPRGPPNKDHRAPSTSNGSRHTEEPKDTVQAIHTRLVSAISEWSAHSEAELSDSSESSSNDAGVEQQGAVESEDQTLEVAEEDEGLLCQIADLVVVLRQCDEVHQLVLRNTGMTDALLQRLTPAIISSKSEVETINLNLNRIRPRGAKSLVRLLRGKRSVRSLLLYGNHLGAPGVRTLMSGLSALWLPVSGAPSVWSPMASGLQLSELDIGGNQMGSDGLRSVSAFLRLQPPLRQLCLAQSSVDDMAAWEELFDVVKVNTSLTHLLLDDNDLGDRGAALVSALIRVNRSLRSLDLDGNDIGEDGGRAILGSMRSGSALTNISLENNLLSAATINAINRALRAG